jgi:uncharacterized protein involved in tolerance to divalent cations
MFGPCHWARSGAIASVHTSTVPEVIALPVVDGSESYLSWLDREVG